MRLKIVRNLGAEFPKYYEGDIREVEDKTTAENLIKFSLAEETDEDITPIDEKTGRRIPDPQRFETPGVTGVRHIETPKLATLKPSEPTRATPDTKRDGSK